MPFEVEISEREAAEADAPLAHVLSNGRLTTLLSAAGGGGTALGRFALTRWYPDRTRDADGSFVYVRDVGESAGASGASAWWSIGFQPRGVAGSAYAARFSAGRAEIRREDDGVHARMEVCVAADADAELRRITLVNRSGRARRLELTTYMEAVLNTPAGDASHPAFSKLFVQTEHDPSLGALLAQRRLRSPDDAPLWVAHLLRRADRDSSGDAMEWETDRMRFIGRGRSTSDPRALDAGASLSGTTGAVLDPVLAVRRTVDLAPDETATFVALLAASDTRDGVAAIVRALADARAVDAAFDGARVRADAVLSDLGLGDADSDRARAIAAAVGRIAYAHPSAPDASAWRSALDDRAYLEKAVALLRNGAGGVDSPATSAAGSARERAGEARQPRFRPAEGPVPSPQSPLPTHGFSDDGTEYVIRLAEGGDRPPLPWANVIANERAGFIATESGAGYTWSANSRENRVSPWSNDPVSDPHGEALWLRDEEGGVFWSPTPGPTPAPGEYEVRHGFGYTTWTHESHGLAQEVTAFVPRHDPVKVVRLRVTNRGGRARRLTATSYAQLVLGVFPWETARSVVTSVEDGVVVATNPSNGEFSHLVAFATAHGPRAREAELTTDRAAFLGRHGSVRAPAALRSERPLAERVGHGFDPCAVLRLPLDVEPGDTAECVFLLGQAASDAEALAVASRFRDPAAVERALEEMREFWRDLLGGVQVETGVDEIDHMVNGWLSYQNLSCRIWGRSAFYQSGGAYGFRDQLQDAAALLHLDPSITRRQIVLNAAHQFVEGDVLHWWHPPLSKGMRTRFSDDLLWLPLLTSYYVESTGDWSVLEEQARFVDARPLEPGEDEVFLVPTDSGEKADVYEHCCRALDRSLTAGAHGLPLMGVGDWNDGMNRVGREGRGESVWLGFFLAQILDRFVSICERRGDGRRAEVYRSYLGRLAERLNAEGAGWDGEWYRRAYYDDGTPLGAASNDECRIDTIAQAWSVISGVAPPDRARQALDAMERHLVSEREGIIRLLTPAFDRTPHDPGYIKGYLPGVRENGGQYTHGALWAVKALAEVGREERAARLLGMLSPASHARTPEDVAVYQTEPYVVAADVYGVAPHVGRGGWTWYTGSAGWMFRVALESVIGLELVNGDRLLLRPCWPADRPGFTVRYRLSDRRTVYEIVVRRSASGERAETTATLDGGESLALRDGAVEIPLRFDGAAHRVEVSLGSGIVPRYEARGAVPSNAWTIDRATAARSDT